ncbi:MAG TPA: tRNA (N6-isopentenyl adenosine(37)-C2)-methylthiotransferase MiaB [Candidatus Brocadiales bacterium]|nr:tRNA (N6-isopentenyl adenosine(37)-C2)-methylthiotransferase MiaB [Candidatus Brocadiales bacterium]
MKSIFLTTFGCQMNKADSELSLGLLLERGYQLAGDESSADVVLFNTCSVRQRAEDRVYSRLSQLKARKTQRPGLVIGVLGCVAQKEGEEIFRRYPHVDMVCGTRMFDKLPELLERLGSNGGHLLAVSDEKVVSYPRRRPPRENPYQAYITVMRGCDNYCSYCIVPHVRGPEISRTVEEIVEEAQSLVNEGCKEITLLGQNINTYGKTLEKGTNLASLLRAVSKVEGLKRIRFVTSHPKDMTREVLEAMAELPKVCKHLHIPAQSGSDHILEEMERGHTAQHYLELIRLARRLVPDIAIVSDFIVGFPGETEEYFEDTVRLMESARFQNSYVFKYSPRPGTKASELPDSVPLELKKERNQRLLDVQSRISLEENKKRVGQIVEVLVEGPSKSNKKRLTGRTPQNQIVVFEGISTLKVELIKVRIEEVPPLTLFGCLITPPPPS